MTFRIDIDTKMKMNNGHITRYNHLISQYSNKTIILVINNESFFEHV